MALSHRGQEALKLIGIEDEVLKQAVRMSKRVIHNSNGYLPILYDV